MKGTCKLFDIETDLRESHIYPKFVVDYFKSTGSKFMRRFAEPNRRIQDGIKKYLLSEEAEQKFSLREKWFSENIFKEYLENGKKTFDYDERLYYFTASFLWRVLLLNLDNPGISQQPYYNTLLEAEKEWKSFLRDSFFPEKFNRFYLFFTDRVVTNNTGLKGVDYYMSRALDATIVSTPNNKFIAVYGKFLRFIFWGIIKGADESKISDLKINPIGGKIGSPQRFDENIMTGFLGNRIREFESMPKASENQQNLIIKDLLKNKESFIKSDAGKAILNDHLNLDKNE